MQESIEHELKLTPADPVLLDTLASVDRLGPFAVHNRRREQQRNAFFDNREHGFQHARVGFRRRIIEGQRLATWTIKGNGTTSSDGIASRPEIALQLDPDMPPGLVLGTLRDTARQRGAAALAEQVGDALAMGGLPLARPILETETDRTILDLTTAGTRLEMALDRVQLLGHSVRELEIEVELREGDLAALEKARAAIGALGETRESHGSKLSRALAHLRECHCARRQP